MHYHQPQCSISPKRQTNYPRIESVQTWCSSVSRFRSFRFNRDTSWSRTIRDLRIRLFRFVVIRIAFGCSLREVRHAVRSRSNTSIERLRPRIFEQFPFRIIGRCWKRRARLSSSSHDRLEQRILKKASQNEIHGKKQERKKMLTRPPSVLPHGLSLTAGGSTGFSAEGRRSNSFGLPADSGVFTASIE